MSGHIGRWVIRLTQPESNYQLIPLSYGNADEITFIFYETIIAQDNRLKSDFAKSI